MGWSVVGRYAGGKSYPQRGARSGEWRSGEEGGKMIENRLSDDRL